MCPLEQPPSALHHYPLKTLHVISRNGYNPLVCVGMATWCTQNYVMFHMLHQIYKINTVFITWPIQINHTYLCLKYKHQWIIRGCHRIALALVLLLASICCIQKMWWKELPGIVEMYDWHSEESEMPLTKPLASSSRQIPSCSTTLESFSLKRLAYLMRIEFLLFRCLILSTNWGADKYLHEETG